MKKRVSILGSGISGIGAAILAKEKGYDVFVSDINKINSKTKNKLDSISIPWEENNHSYNHLKKSDLIIALNLFELVEPSLMLKSISKQISDGVIFLSDPYDYDRGKNSVKNPLNENQIRDTLVNNGFKIIKNTKKPAKLNWNLRINKRTQLNYKVDLIIARKNC